MTLNTAEKPCKPDLYFKEAVKNRLQFAMRTDQLQETKSRETLTWHVQMTTTHPLFKIRTMKLGLPGVLKAFNWTHKVLQHNKSRPAVSRSRRCITRMDWMQYHQISEGGGIKSLCSVWQKNSKWRSFSHQSETWAKIILVVFWRTWRDKVTGTGHKGLKNLRQSKNMH